MSISFNYDDHNLSEIEYIARKQVKRLGLEAEFGMLNTYFFGAKQSRDDESDIFVSERLFRKMTRTLYFLNTKGFKVTVGIPDLKETGTGQWMAFSHRMRNKRPYDCARTIICMIYEINALLKTDVERGAEQCAG